MPPCINTEFASSVGKPPGYILTQLSADKILYIDKSRGQRRKQMTNISFIQPAFVLFLFLVFQPVFSSAGDLYKWADDEGVVHMTDTLSQVPPQYRDQVDRKTLQITTQPDTKAESQRSSGDAGANLKHFEVPYQAFEGTSRRIIIPVTFNESVSARLLLDTGSPGLMISPELADRLGLLDEQGGNLYVLTGGIGGSVPAILAVVDSVRVGDARAEFLPATITQMPSGEFEGLVGMDFMANYKIGIDTANSILVFYELPPQVDRPGGHDEAWWRHNFQTFDGLKAKWGNYLQNLEKKDMTSSEKERQLKIARNQYDQADQLCRKLERYARDNAVPVQWRR
jgi:hypothetical protein